MFRFTNKIFSKCSVINCLISFESKHGVSRISQHSNTYKGFNNFSSDASQSNVTPRPFSVVAATCQAPGSITTFLTQTFFKDEPLVVAVGLGGSPSEELIRHCNEALSENLSLVAVSPSGEIIGVALNGTQEAVVDVTKHRAELAACKCPKTAKLLRFWHHVETCGDMRRFGVPCVLELKFLATSPASRGKGVGTALLEATTALARDKGYRLVRVDCTSHYSALAAERVGFSCVYSLDYKDYVDGDRQPVFQAQPPHCAVKVYVGDLNTLSPEISR